MALALGMSGLLHSLDTSKPFAIKIFATILSFAAAITAVAAIDVDPAVARMDLSKLGLHILMGRCYGQGIEKMRMRFH
ncbi:hypothetical protein BST61_g4796 [Cercospora zeina]